MRKWKGIEAYQDARLISAFSDLSRALGISPHSKETQESWWNLIAPEGRWPFNTDGNVYFISFF